MAIEVPAGYSYHFYITSSSDNWKWVEDTANDLESEGFKGQYESRDKVGGVPVLELVQSFNKKCHKVIIGFGDHDEREKFKALDTLEVIFNKNDPRDSHRLILVKLFPESHVPECLRQYSSLEVWHPHFKKQLVNSIKPTQDELNTDESGTTPSTAHGLTCSGVSTDGVRDSSTTQGAAAAHDIEREQIPYPDTNKGKSMEELLRRCIGDFMMKASLPVKEIYYSISDILYVNEKAETKENISDDDKRSMLIGILLNTMLKPEEFEKCSKVFAPYLNVKPIEEGSSGRSTETFHQQLLSNYKDELARDLPYQKVFDKMQDVFSLKEKSDIQEENLFGFDKSRLLVDTLLTKGHEVSKKFLEVLLQLDKPVQEDSHDNQEMIDRMNNMAISQPLDRSPYQTVQDQEQYANYKIVW